MAPLFEFSRAWVSDAPTPFLQAFESEWLLFPNAEHDDTLDAVYWMLSVAQNNIMPVDSDGFSMRKRTSQSMFNFGRF
jgi:phage terminase large subunit-like protein